MMANTMMMLMADAVDKFIGQFFLVGLALTPCAVSEQCAKLPAPSKPGLQIGRIFSKVSFGFCRDTLKFIERRNFCILSYICQKTVRFS